MEGMASGLCSYPPHHLHSNRRTLTEHLPCAWSCAGDTAVMVTAPALPFLGSVSRQGQPRVGRAGTGEPRKAQHCRSRGLSPGPARKKAPRGTKHFLVTLIIVERVGVGSKDPTPGKEVGYRTRSETEEEERG